MVYQSIHDLKRDYDQLLDKIFIAETVMANYLNYNPLAHIGPEIVSFHMYALSMSTKIELMRKRLVAIDTRRFMYYHYHRMDVDRQQFFIGCDGLG
jgi:hypothetical protein